VDLKNKPKHTFTPKEVEFILKNFGKISATKIAEIIGCSRRAIYTIIKREQLKGELKQFPLKKNKKLFTESFYKSLKRQDIIILLSCRWCGKSYIFKKPVFAYNCKCGKNLIWHWNVNYYGAKILYMSDKLKNNCLRTYDKWRD